jgi:hypothetical protein
MHMPADDRNLTAYILEKKINDTLRVRAQQKHDLSQTRYDVEGETLHSRFWTRTAVGYHLKETIHEFIKPDSSATTPQYESRPKLMAEIARNYHDSVQQKDMPDAYAKLLATSIVLEQCDAHLKREQHDLLNQKLLALELKIALRISKNGSAPGIDGLLYEFYKWLEIEFRNDPDNTLDILDFLEALFTDIETYGIVPGTDFNTGWMCPIYKKGDRAQVANYRPITLLNVDYKLLTKAHSLRLAEVAPESIHRDQAGFMKGRKIEDQVKQLKHLLDYADAVEENGIVVALHQEKVYDRIDHDYLLAVLKHM